MLRENNNLANAKQRRGAFWLALFSIGWLQLSLAAHQFEHVAQQLGQSCEVCVQLDRADDAAVDSSPTTLAERAGDPLARQAPASVAAATRTVSFDSRAPPRI